MTNIITQLSLSTQHFFVLLDKFGNLVSTLYVIQVDIIFGEESFSVRPKEEVFIFPIHFDGVSKWAIFVRRNVYGLSEKAANDSRNT